MQIVRQIIERMLPAITDSTPFSQTILATFKRQHSDRSAKLSIKSRFIAPKKMNLLIFSTVLVTQKMLWRCTRIERILVTSPRSNMKMKFIMTLLEVSINSVESYPPFWKLSDSGGISGM